MGIKEVQQQERTHLALLVHHLALDLLAIVPIEDQTAALEVVLRLQLVAQAADLHLVVEAIDHLAAQAEAVEAQVEVALDHHLVLAEEEEEISRLF